MSTPSVRRKVLVLLLLSSVLTAPGAFAGRRLERPRPVNGAELAPLALVSRAWSLLTSLWSKTGCHIDPDGRCVSEPIQPLPTADAGCNIDPNGGCGS
jgi:hypothetical protein